MVENEILSALKDCLPNSGDQALLDAHKSGEDIDFSDLDLTSLRMVEIGMHIEQSLGIDIDLEELEEAKGFLGLVDHCKSLLAVERHS